MVCVCAPVLAQGKGRKKAMQDSKSNSLYTKPTRTEAYMSSFTASQFAGGNFS